MAFVSGDKEQEELPRAFVFLIIIVILERVRTGGNNNYHNDTCTNERTDNIGQL